MFTVSFTHDTYLLGTATGEAELADLCGLTMFVAETARRTSMTEVVLDLLAVTSRLTDAEKHELEKLVAMAFRDLRVACVIASTEKECVSSKFAVAAGLAYSTFTDLRDAEHWVKSRQAAVA